MFDTGLLSLFQWCIVGWCNPRWITKGFPFHMWARAQQAGGRGSVELSRRRGTSFPGGGDPSSSYLHRGFFFRWEASQAQVSVGTILMWDSTRPDPVASYREVTGRPSGGNRQHEILKYPQNDETTVMHRKETAATTAFYSLCGRV